MKKKDYSIDYKGLSVGSHEFDFVIDGSFFQEKETDRIYRLKVPFEDLYTSVFLIH